MRTLNVALVVWMLMVGVLHLGNISTEAGVNWNSSASSNSR